MERNTLLNHSFVMRSMHKHTDRYDPYHHSKWAQYRNPQVQDTGTAFSEHSSDQDQSYSVSQVNGHYYFDPPYQVFSDAQEEAAFHMDIVRLREEKSLKVALNSQQDQRAARICTISPSPSVAEQLSANHIHPSRLNMIKDSKHSFAIIARRRADQLIRSRKAFI